MGCVGPARRPAADRLRRCHRGGRRRTGAAAADHAVRRSRRRRGRPARRPGDQRRRRRRAAAVRRAARTTARPTGATTGTRGSSPCSTPADDAGLPVLGVCRGMQVMAVHAGGRSTSTSPTWSATTATTRRPVTFGDTAVALDAGEPARLPDRAHAHGAVPPPPGGARPPRIHGGRLGRGRRPRSDGVAGRPVVRRGPVAPRDGCRCRPVPGSGRCRFLPLTTSRWYSLQARRLPRRNRLGQSSGTPMSELSEVCIVGAGITGLNALVVASSYLQRTDTVVLVDSRTRSGGMWVDTYDYVRLHQPHPIFTAGNIKWTLDQKPNHLATKPEVLDHLQRCLEVARKRVDLEEHYGWIYVSHVEADGLVHVTLRSPEGGTRTVVTRRLIKAFGHVVRPNAAAGHDERPGPLDHARAAGPERPGAARRRHTDLDRRQRQDRDGRRPPAGHRAPRASGGHAGRTGDHLRPARHVLPHGCTALVGRHSDQHRRAAGRQPLRRHQRGRGPRLVPGDVRHHAHPGCEGLLQRLPVRVRARGDHRRPGRDRDGVLHRRRRPGRGRRAGHAQRPFPAGAVGHLAGELHRLAAPQSPSLRTFRLRHGYDALPPDALQSDRRLLGVRRLLPDSPDVPRRPRPMRASMRWTWRTSTGRPSPSSSMRR